MKKLVISVVLLLSTQAYAGPSKAIKAKVQTAMKTYVNELIAQNGFMPVVHEGEVLKLSLLKTKKYPDGFHAGVIEQGHLFASCADFTDTKGNTYDIDFLVSQTNAGHKVVQPIVHSINGKKSKYDLDH